MSSGSSDIYSMQISDLKANARNPRKISNEKREMLKKALDRFGDLSGIVFNRQTGQLVGGHQRVSVLPKDVLIEASPIDKTTAGTVAEGHVVINGERFKYREVDWDLVTEEAANIAANQHGGEWDDRKLVEIVNDLFKSGMDMDLIGFSKEEIERLIGMTVDITGLPSLEVGDKSQIQQITFTLSDDQANIVRQAVDQSINMGDFIDTDNENKNGNALARICEFFIGKS